MGGSGTKESKFVHFSFLTSNHSIRGTEQAFLKENQRNLFHRFVNGPGRDGRLAIIPQDGKKEVTCLDGINDKACLSMFYPRLRCFSLLTSRSFHFLSEDLLFHRSQKSRE